MDDVKKINQEETKQLFTYCFGEFFLVVIVVGLMVFYRYCAPYSGPWISVLSGTLLFFLSFMTFELLISNEILSYLLDVFSKRFSFSESSLQKIIIQGKCALRLIFWITWGYIVISAPGNVYSEVFKPNKFIWFDQGKCSEIAKYEESLVKQCEDAIIARKNLIGTFTIIDKTLTTDATSCLYSVTSDNGLIAKTKDPQTCGFELGQKVFVNLTSFPLDKSISTIRTSIQIAPLK